MFAGNFAPRNWAFCDGQLLSIAQNTALFSILGTTYGGDGRTSFGLPDLRSRVPVGEGRGNGLSNYALGQHVGLETTTLNINNLPNHTHTAAVTGITATAEATISIPATSETGNTIEPDSTVILSTGEVQKNQNEVNGFSTDAADTNLKPFTAPVTVTATGGTVTVGPTGNSAPFYNIQPSIGMNYIICLQGMFPPRS